GSTQEEIAAALDIGAAVLDETVRNAIATEVPSWTWTAPEAVPLLRELLLLASEKRRQSEATSWLGLEADVDRLHDALRAQQRTEGERLRGQKLSALAECAGGAGHEINHPLAVVSGRAQYLLSLWSDPPRPRSLQT